MTTAERLFAEYGVVAVSNRQIGEAAGQGNTAVVGYHFGTKTDLVTAIIRRHNDDIERVRASRMTSILGSTELRDWVTCLVYPQMEHLESRGTPTWCARFIAQVMTDPALRRLAIDDALGAPSTQQAIDGLGRCLSALPPEVRAERAGMARQLLVHVPAERERLLADGLATTRPTWHEVGTGLIDAICGLYLAPFTGTSRQTTEGNDEDNRGPG